MTFKNVDDVLEAIGLGWAQARVLFSGGMIFCLASIISLVGSTKLPGTQTSDIAHAAAVCILFAGASLGSLLSGAVSDYAGRRRAILLGLSVCLVTISLTTVCVEFVGILITRVFVGVGLGMATPSWCTLITEISPIKSRCYLFAVSMCMQSLAALLFVSFWMFVRWDGMFWDESTPEGWRWLHAGAATLVGLGLLLCWVLLIESPHHLFVSGHIEECLDSLRALAKHNGKPDLNVVFFEQPLMPMLRGRTQLGVTGLRLERPLSFWKEVLIYLRMATSAHYSRIYKVLMLSAVLVGLVLKGLEFAGEQTAAEGEIFGFFRHPGMIMVSWFGLQLPFVIVAAYVGEALGRRNGMKFFTLIGGSLLLLCVVLTSIWGVGECEMGLEGALGSVRGERGQEVKGVLRSALVEGGQRGDGGMGGTFGFFNVGDSFVDSREGNSGGDSSSVNAAAIERIFISILGGGCGSEMGIGWGGVLDSFPFFSFFSEGRRERRKEDTAREGTARELGELDRSFAVNLQKNDVVTMLPPFQNAEKEEKEENRDYEETSRRPNDSFEAQQHGKGEERVGAKTTETLAKKSSILHGSRKGDPHSTASSMVFPTPLPVSRQTEAHQENEKRMSEISILEERNAADGGERDDEEMEEQPLVEEEEGRETEEGEQEEGDGQAGEKEEEEKEHPKDLRRISPARHGIHVGVCDTVRYSLAVFALLAVGCAFCHSAGVLMRLYSAEAFPTVCRGTGTGLVSSAYWFGGAIAPLLHETLVYTGPGYMAASEIFVFVVGASAVAAFACLVCLKVETKGRPLNHFYSGDTLRLLISQCVRFRARILRQNGEPLGPEDVEELLEGDGERSRMGSVSLSLSGREGESIDRDRDGHRGRRQRERVSGGPMQQADRDGETGGGRFSSFGGDPKRNHRDRAGSWGADRGGGSFQFGDELSGSASHSASASASPSAAASPHRRSRLLQTSDSFHMDEWPSVAAMRLTQQPSQDSPHSPSLSRFCTCAHPLPLQQSTAPLSEVERLEREEEHERFVRSAVQGGRGASASLLPPLTQTQRRGSDRDCERDSLSFIACSMPASFIEGSRNQPQQQGSTCERERVRLSAALSEGHAIPSPLRSPAESPDLPSASSRGRERDMSFLAMTPPARLSDAALMGGEGKGGRGDRGHDHERERRQPPTAESSETRRRPASAAAGALSASGSSHREREGQRERGESRFAVRRLRDRFRRLRARMSERWQRHDDVIMMPGASADRGGGRHSLNFSSLVSDGGGRGKERLRRQTSGGVGSSSILSGTENGGSGSEGRFGCGRCGGVLTSGGFQPHENSVSIEREAQREHMVLLDAPHAGRRGEREREHSSSSSHHHEISRLVGRYRGRCMSASLLEGGDETEREVDIAQRANGPSALLQQTFFLTADAGHEGGGTGTERHLPPSSFSSSDRREMTEAKLGERENDRQTLVKHRSAPAKEGGGGAAAAIPSGRSSITASPLLCQPQPHCQPPQSLSGSPRSIPHHPPHAHPDDVRDNPSRDGGAEQQEEQPDQMIILPPQTGSSNSSVHPMMHQYDHHNHQRSSHPMVPSSSFDLDDRDQPAYSESRPPDPFTTYRRQSAGGESALSEEVDGGSRIELL